MVTKMGDIYQAFYTKSDPITGAMVDALSISAGMHVLEPCGGDGVFVDALLAHEPDLDIDVYELDPTAVSTLQTKYAHQENVVNIFHDDTLTSPTLRLAAMRGGIYDRIIANPPYGAWQDYSRRDSLKKLFPDLYVKETYTLFLYKSLELLKNDGILVFIIPDTFLNLHRHTAVRNIILRQSRILNIKLFPSSFFPDVNFGYAGLSILTFQKTFDESLCMENEFSVDVGFESEKALCDPDGAERRYYFNQKDVLAQADHALFISDNPAVTHHINTAVSKIGDIAACVTGFYSGDDKRYLRSGNIAVRNGKKYAIVDSDLVHTDYPSPVEKLSGLTNGSNFIPVVKGGNVQYYKPDLWYMDWGAAAVQQYKTSKKARFQNPSYYFREGIGVPMVSSSKITASLLNGRLFDQSIVGIFPHDDSDTLYLLAFFNSPTCNTLIRTINPTANNSANYIKKIPFLKPDRTAQKRINTIIDTIISSLKSGKNDVAVKLETEMHDIIKSIYGF